jgi:hypothetical protein
MAVIAPPTTGEMMRFARTTRFVPLRVRVARATWATRSLALAQWDNLAVGVILTEPFSFSLQKRSGAERSRNVRARADSIATKPNSHVKQSVTASPSKLARSCHRVGPFLEAPTLTQDQRHVSKST